MDTTAVFDAVWHAPAAAAPAQLAVAGGDGAAHLYQLDGGGRACALVASAPLTPTTEGAEAPLCTSVHWDRLPGQGAAGGQGDRLAACGQDGRVHVLQATQARQRAAVLPRPGRGHAGGCGGRPNPPQQRINCVPAKKAALAPRWPAQASLALDRSWQGHALEAWVVRWDAWRPNQFYSGGDDAVFCSWDTRSAAPAFQLRSAHRAGVVSVACCPQEEFLVATGAGGRASGLGLQQGSLLTRPSACPVRMAAGSYDERVRLWDVRKLEMPLMTQAVATGGGCWRLVWHPTMPGLLLCSCMGGGFALVRGGEVRSPRSRRRGSRASFLCASGGGEASPARLLPATCTGHPHLLRRRDGGPARVPGVRGGLVAAGAASAGEQPCGSVGELL